MLHRNRTRRSGRAALLALIACCSFLPLSGLAAEKRTYEAAQGLGDLVVKFVDEMAAAGFVFEVQKIYNANQDRKEGMVLLFGRERKLCEITFHPDANGRRTLFVVTAQDREVASKFHELLTQKVGMREVGVSQGNFDTSWPVRP